MRLCTIFLVVLLGFGLPAFAQGPAVIGTLILVEGSATLTPAEGAASAAKNGSPVHDGDTLETSEKAKLLLMLLDETKIVLSGDAELTVDGYIYDPTGEKDSTANYSIPRGTFDYTGGLAAKNKVKIEAAYGFVDVRGATRFWSGAIDNAYGVLVNEGEVQVSTNEGRVLLNKGMGVTIKDKKEPPGAIRRWSESKIKKTVASVKLKNADKVPAMIASYKALQAPPPAPKTE